MPKSARKKLKPLKGEDRERMARLFEEITGKSARDECSNESYARHAYSLDEISNLVFGYVEGRWSFRAYGGLQ